MLRFAKCPFRNDVRCSPPIVIRHEEPATLRTPAELRELVGHVENSGAAKKVGGVWIVDTCQRHLGQGEESYLYVGGGCL